MTISLIRDRVQVTIERDTAALGRVSFGIPLFIGETDIDQRARLYLNIDEVEEDYGDTDPETLAARAFFSQSPQPREGLVIGFKDDTETYTEALSEIRDVNDEWIAVAIEETNLAEAEATALADAVSALPGFRQLWLRSDDSDILDGQVDTDIASVFQNANHDQARIVYHSLAAEAYPDLAQMGRVLTIPESRTSGPGSTVWYDQQVSGIPGDTFTASQRSALEDKNAEYFINIGGGTRTQGGKMAGGEWGDVVHFVAWLETRLAEDVYQLMYRAADRRQKVPYTDEGIAMVESTVRNRLDIGVSIGGITEDYEVTVPLREETSFDDRANRILRDVNFEAPLAGAIKMVMINGIVTA